MSVDEKWRAYKFFSITISIYIFLNDKKIKTSWNWNGASDDSYGDAV